MPEDRMTVEKPITVQEVRDQLDEIEKWAAGVRKALASMRADQPLSAVEHDRFIGPQPLARNCYQRYSPEREGDPPPDEPSA
jgi:hypothetical protein